MSYKTNHIANRFLERAFRENQEISPMKLQKLIYFLHGWHLAITGKPALNDSLEVWQYGPVISSLYHELKQYGKDPIDSYITEYDPKDGKMKALAISNKEFDEIFDAIWEKYIGFDALQLSQMTHEQNAPWEKCRKEGNRTITNELLKDYFVNIARS